MTHARNERRTRPRPLNTERGSIALFAVCLTTVMLLLLGLVVDMLGQVHTQQRAQDLALQAARVGGQQLDAAAAVRGTGARTDTTRAKAAADGYLRSAGVTGTVNVNPTTVVVDVTTTYSTKVLSMIGVTRLNARGHGESRIARVSAGNEL